MRVSKVNFFHWGGGCVSVFSESNSPKVIQVIEVVTPFFKGISDQFLVTL